MSEESTLRSFIASLVSAECCLRQFDSLHVLIVVIMGVYRRTYSVLEFRQESTKNRPFNQSVFLRVTQSNP